MTEAPIGPEYYILHLTLSNVRLKIYPIVLSIAVSAITACTKSNNPSPKPPTPPVTPAKMDTDVYVAGITQAKNGKVIAAYWKNGVATKLGDSTTYSSVCYGMAIDGNDVYVSGWLLDGNFKSTAVYWKNGVLHTLSPSPSDNSVAYDIAVNGNDVYVSGSMYGTPGFLYWKNGMPVMATGPTNAAVYGGLLINGNDVYQSGTSVLPDLTTNVAAYWKNGAMVQISNINSRGQAITVSGSDVYVAGSTETDLAVPATARACYWKNGVITQLSSTWSDAEGIVVENGDIYISGSTQPSKLTLATYWRNGIAHTVLNNTVQSFGNSIAVIGNDVYMAGSQQQPNGLGDRPLYWKNGVPVLLPFYSSGGCGPIAVVVHPAGN